MSRILAFNHLNKHTSVNTISTYINDMMNEAKDNSEIVVDIFKIWLYKRHVKEGEKEKLLSYRYFLELYNLFPNTCINIVESRLFGTIGYWKDMFLIWGLINNMKLSDSDKYNKYDTLINAFRTTILTQRLEDLRELNTILKPQKICHYSNDGLREKLKNIKHLDISYVGKYCIREKSPFNTALYWYIPSNNGLLKQSHVSYMIRGSLRIRNNNGTIVDYPYNKPVPSTIKKTYRQLNSKLNVALNVPETMLCSKKYELLDPDTFPYLFKQRNKKVLIKNNLYKESNKVTDYKKDSFEIAMDKDIYYELTTILRKSNEGILKFI